MVISNVSPDEKRGVQPATSFSFSADTIHGYRAKSRLPGGDSEARRRHISDAKRRYARSGTRRRGRPTIEAHSSADITPSPATLNAPECRPSSKASTAE